MPVVAEAFAAGRLGREQGRLLAKARADGLEEMFATREEVLVDEVVGCTVAGAARLLRRWAATVRERLGLADPDRPPPNETDHGSRVHLSCGFEGRWALDGSLDPEMGEVLANAIDHQVGAMWRDGVFHADDGLVPAERRAVALAEVVYRGARGGDDDGTARPLVLGLVDLTDHECRWPLAAGEGEGGDSHGVGDDEVELDGLRRCRKPSRGEQGPPAGVPIPPQGRSRPRLPHDPHRRARARHPTRRLTDPWTSAGPPRRPRPSRPDAGDSRPDRPPRSR